MKIGIIVYSYTGNTYSVAEKLRERLTKSGNSVTIEKITAANDQETDPGRVVLQSVPNIGAYEGIIFGAPVRGFSVHAAMKAFLSKVSSLKGKKIACYVTQAFPYPWMGGNSSISQLKQACEAKDANMAKTGIINWSLKRENKIHAFVEDVSNML